VTTGAVDGATQTAEPRPLVSIVVPSYNHGRYLKAAIQSILEQTYPHVELLVIDDGSTDDSVKILEEFAGRFHWEVQSNAGQAATLNKGWNKARGQILSYLSADDRLLPNAVSTAIAHLRRLHETVMVYCDFNLIDDQAQVIRRVHAPDFDYFQMVVGTVCAPGPGVFFRRSAYEAAGGWDREFKQWPDYEYWLRLGLQGSFSRIPEVLAEFRVHGRSQTFARLPFERAEEPVRVLRRYYESSVRIPPEIAGAKNTALSNAELASAQLHFRAGRVRAALSHIRAAATLDFRNFASARTLYVCLHGLLARPLMALWLKLRVRPQ
jgi:glycosyltransferase involved in cell wall biosynthesis